jgi:hypothetical protein
MLKRLFEIQPDETLRKAVYVADEMREYFNICFVSQLEEKGFSFRFIKHPDKILEIEIFPEMTDPDDPIMLTHKLRDDGSYLVNCFNRTVDQAVKEAKEIIGSWK